jgi:hypothetical protein
MGSLKRNLRAIKANSFVLTCVWAEVNFRKSWLMGINVNPSWLHKTTSINCKSKCLGVRFEFKFTTKALLFLWGLLNIIKVNDES